jgi:cyclophilin family peptidyl-prolyl cis-trans isomerase
MLTNRARWVIACPTVGILIIAGFLAGCGSKSDADSPGPSPKMAVPAAATAPGGHSAAQVSNGPADYPRQFSFLDATLAEPPEDQWLPELTKSGKSVGKLYKQVVAKWDKVPLESPAGKKLAYAAQIKTDLGQIEIELRPDLAPNHVRSFVALAQAGYFDGLAFDRVIRRDRAEGNNGRFECVEAGCPVGTGDSHYGSIGYWLKPELRAAMTHEEGTVGAWHGEQVESAACKFYITLTKAEWMDGRFTVFGNVTKGLDVVRAIHSGKTLTDDPDRPQDPIIMRQVTINGREQ